MSKPTIHISHKVLADMASMHLGQTLHFEVMGHAGEATAPLDMIVEGASDGVRIVDVVPPRSPQTTDQMVTEPPPPADEEGASDEGEVDPLAT